jgi:hypothetical protein
MKFDLSPFGMLAVGNPLLRNRKAGNQHVSILLNQQQITWLRGADGST